MTAPLYNLEVSPLYGLPSKKKLLEYLPGITLKQLIEVSESPLPFYHFTRKETKPGKWRDVSKCFGELGRIQERLQELLRRIQLPDYLFSKRCSSTKGNAELHKDSDFAFTIDLKDFYPNCSTSRLAKALSFHFKQPGDIAHLLARLMTVNGTIPQGSTTSTIAAFISNKSMFDEIFSYCSLQNLKFSVFVDDLTISGNGKIEVEVRNAIIRIIRKNSMPISYKKTKYFKRGQHKHVTGIAFKAGQLKVENKKFQRLFREVLPENGKNQKSKGLYKYMKNIDNNLKIAILES